MNPVAPHLRPRTGTIASRAVSLGSTVAKAHDEFSGSTESYHDGRNSPRQAALAFQSVVADALRVPAGPPVVHHESEDGTMLFCIECDRRCGPGAIDCLYCGGELEEVGTIEEDSGFA